MTTTTEHDHPRRLCRRTAALLVAGALLAPALPLLALVLRDAGLPAGDEDTPTGIGDDVPGVVIPCGDACREAGHPL